LLLAVLGTGVALADAHSDREAVMKANGGAVRALNGLVANFDAAATPPGAVSVRSCSN
jgi:cytochrome c556